MPRVRPAHAGIIPVRSTGHLGLSGPPRTRGDHPRWRVRRRDPRRSAPHTRGSSPIWPMSFCRYRVRPAHAGIIPWMTRNCRSCGCPPRTRGDHPGIKHALDHRNRSAPHTRGSSPFRVDHRRRLQVRPAHAGIIRSLSWSGLATRRPPRTRGDHPPSSDVASRVPKSAPHTRGSSGERPESFVTAEVRPAHAGIIPDLVQRSKHIPGPPHTRGELSNGPAIVVGNHRSAPHTRGAVGCLGRLLGELDASLLAELDAALRLHLAL